MHWIKKRNSTFPNGDRKTIEVIQTNDQTFRDGIKFSMAYLSYDEKEDKYEPAFAIDNSHEPAHIHRTGRKDAYADYDWKMAAQEFDKMVREYRKIRGFNDGRLL